MDEVLGKFLKHGAGHNILTTFWVDKTGDSLPVLIGTIKSISLKIGFVNLVILGVCFLQDVRQASELT
jgi:hypothetical protein